jgi:hypothetical protein
MKLVSLDTAEAIAKRVNSKLKEWEIPISVRPSFVVMVSLVIRELRAETKRPQESSNEGTQTS